MKKLFIGILSVTLLFSCDSNDDKIEQSIDESIIGKWNLSKVFLPHAQGTISSNFNEAHFYRLNSDATFKRVNLDNEEVSNSLEGTYIVTDENSLYNNEDILHFIELTYSSDVIFSNCGFIDDNQQLLILNSDNSLQNTLDDSCDGVSYEYTKEE